MQTIKASELISRLFHMISETGQDLDLDFVLDAESWYPRLNLSLLETEWNGCDNSATFRFTTGGQLVQSDEGFRFREVASHAWKAETSKS